MEKYWFIVLTDQSVMIEIEKIINEKILQRTTKENIDRSIILIYSINNF